jgi:ADP-ribosylglycohydrolase
VAVYWSAWTHASGRGRGSLAGLGYALWFFLRYGDTPEECVVRAVNFGGDADTVGAMAGALAGALHGAAWIPSRWHDAIENGPRGRDEIITLARKLARLEVRG